MGLGQLPDADGDARAPAPLWSDRDQAVSMAWFSGIKIRNMLKAKFAA
jgi:hypothetical protein